MKSFSQRSSFIYMESTGRLAIDVTRFRGYSYAPEATKKFPLALAPSDIFNGLYSWWKLLKLFSLSWFQVQFFYPPAPPPLSLPSTGGPKFPIKKKKIIHHWMLQCIILTIKYDSRLLQFILIEPSSIAYTTPFQLYYHHPVWLITLFYFIQE